MVLIQRTQIARQLLTKHSLKGVELGRTRRRIDFGTKGSKRIQEGIHLL